MRLCFRRDVLRLISPEEILDAKTDMYCPFGMAKEHTQMQKGTNVNTSQQMHILTKQAALARTKTKQAAMYPETAEYVSNYILREVRAHICPSPTQDLIYHLQPHALC